MTFVLGVWFGGMICFALTLLYELPRAPDFMLDALRRRPLLATFMGLVSTLLWPLTMATLLARELPEKP